MGGKSQWQGMPVERQGGIFEWLSPCVSRQEMTCKRQERIVKAQDRDRARRVLPVSWQNSPAKRCVQTNRVIWRGPAKFHRTLIKPSDHRATGIVFPFLL